MLLVVTSLFSQTMIEPPSNINDHNVGSIENPYLISSLANLRWLSEEWWGWSGYMPEPDVENYHFLQTADIDASDTINWNDGRGFIPIGHGLFFGGIYNDFVGTYDGNNCAISNLYMTNSRNFNFEIGMFGQAFKANIINLSLINAIIDGHEDSVKLGLLVAYAYDSTIRNCSVSGTITKQTLTTTGSYTTKIGGLIGEVHRANIEYCQSEVIINVPLADSVRVGNVGGLIGSMEGSNLRDSFYKGSIMISPIADDLGVGGVVGQVTDHYNHVLDIYAISTVQNVYSVLYSEGNEFPCGLAYSVNASNFSNSFWNDELTESMEDFHTIEGNSVVTGNIGLPTELLKQAQTFIDNGWDFVNIWGIDSNINGGYPYLRDAPTVSDKDTTIIPAKLQLLGNYPNPFNPTTTISFTNTKVGNVTIDVFNTKGQKVRSLLNGFYGVGEHSVVWNGLDDKGGSVGSGVYFYRMKTDEYNETKKMLLMK
jgi:hypothetical protein